MRRLFLLLLLVPGLLAVPAFAQATDSTAAAACVDPDDGATLMAAAGSSDGGVAADPSGTDGSSSGGTPAVWDGGTADTTVGDASTVAGDTATAPADTPGAVVAQEPEPEPEGPGEEQPGDPEPQPPPVETPEIPSGEAPAGEAPVGDTGGGLPRTGIEALQLALLGVVLFLVGARIRVLALRRRRHAPDPGAHASHGYYDPEPAYDDDFDEPPPLPARHAAGRDEWAFPDPSEPAPTGLLPSTASARRQAREMALAGDRE